MKRFLTIAVAAVLTAAVLAGTAAARGPAGRTFNGAVFSAGVSGDPDVAAGPAIRFASPFDSLVRVSTDQGVTGPLTAEELTTSGRVTIDSQTEPMVSINQSNRSNVVGIWQEDRWTSGGARNLVFGTSFDGGRTWANIPLQGVGILAGGEFQRVTDPWVDFGPSNRVYAFSLGFDDTGPDNGLFVSTSTDGGLTWGAQVPVIIDRQFEFFNDKNALTADDWASSPHRGNVYVAWDRLIEDPLGKPFVGTYTGPAMFSRSTDGGASFSTPQVVFATGTNKQTIGNVPVVFPNGDVAVLGTFFENSSFGKNSQKLWIALSKDGGATFTVPRLVMDMQSLPVPGIRSGDTVPMFAVAPDGTLYASWQDVRFSNGKRTDVLVTSSRDEGQTWSIPVKANDTPADAQDAFTPAIAVDARGRVGILYYDLRDDASTKDGAFMTAEWFTTSNDGGRTWSQSRRLTPAFDHAAAAPAGGFFLGDYQGLDAAGTSFQPFFAANLAIQANGALGSDTFSTRLR
ncbi:MAG TPA: sialidase family protein [Gaiellaceae bacterium]|nr:sialidase family protein [Gaiellaceae bacterium]